MVVNFSDYQRNTKSNYFTKCLVRKPKQMCHQRLCYEKHYLCVCACFSICVPSMRSAIGVEKRALDPLELSHGVECSLVC